ncbi:expressed unknown protein [Ectocarpus siliculosus]|uniref:Uncharacterized protein n=1 Tax=Ectocarpus siliculosus TaxID=2880 RepID=D7FST6_ECTSI|nr:expressed unknown protein [Ectocarpus siliculosus]|eukprot:CBJ31227.1 expressed unknown protein [Ectocarpus siliculosus]
MGRSPAALPRLVLVVATLCLLSAPNTVVLRVDAQSRDCSDLLLACDESDFCSACLASTSEPAYAACESALPSDLFVCQYAEYNVCCYNEASGNDCVGDPVTYAYLECLWDTTDSCEDDDWTCSGSFTAAPTPAPSELTVSASVAPTASGDSEDTDTTSGGSALFSTSVGRVATGLLAFCAAAAAVVV